MKNKKILLFDNEKLTYKTIKKRWLIIGTGLLLLLNVILLTSNNVQIKKVSNKIDNLNHTPLSKEHINPSRNKAWKDSVFTDYNARASVYLSRPEFTGTPLTAKLLTLCARNTYDSTGVLVPVELALLQAQVESSMGRAGRSPVNNPFNIGEAVNGTTWWSESTFEGTQKYYFIMANNYLRCKTVEQLLLNFTNCNGRRYAEKITYEITMSGEYIRIKNWINNNL